MQKFVVKRNWLRCLCLAAALGLAAAPAAFAGGEKASAKKPVISGFIDMQDINWHNEDDGKPPFTLDYIKPYPGLFGGIVVNATWNEMQPAQGGALVSGRVDRAIAQVRRYNRDNPTLAPLAVKLRVFAGNQAPAWAKAINGPPLTIQRNPQGCPSHDCPITIGRVWDPQYIAAWRAFQKLLAAHYDKEPLVRSVAITSCTMETDEPFVMPVDQPIPTGYTDAADKACLRGAVDDYAPWKRTAIDFTFNVFDAIQKKTQDPDFSLSVMKACRAKLGDRCELGNHAFASVMGTDNTLIVQAISDKGAPIHYQTAGPNSKGFQWTDTMRAARKYNATAIELWPQFGGFTNFSLHKMKRLHALFVGDK